MRTISQRVPDHSTRAQVVVQYEDIPPATLNPSANLPVVEILSPDGGENWNGLPPPIRWTASDADERLIWQSDDVGGDRQ